MWPFLLLACLPAADDPAADPGTGGEPPAPTRSASRKQPTVAGFVVKGPKPVPVAYSARGDVPKAVTIEGARVNVGSDVKWVKAGRAGDGIAYTLPNRFVEGLQVADVQVDGAPCTYVETPAAPGDCGLVGGALAFVAAKGGKPPQGASFVVDPAVAAREAEIRGRDTFVEGFSAVAYTVDGFEAPVLSPEGGAIQLTVAALPPEAHLRFRPVLLPSPIWAAADDATDRLEVLSRVKEEPGPRVLLDLLVTPDAAPVDITLGDAVPPYSQLTFRMDRGPGTRLGPVLALADAEIGR